MLNAARSLTLSAQSAPDLPRVEELEDLYQAGFRPRQGEVMMVAGRSGTQKSGFALWWASRMNLPTLYLSADMTSFQASVRLACSLHDMTVDEVQYELDRGSRKANEIRRSLSDLNFTFSFGSITWRGLDTSMEAYVEARNEYPKLIVVDNLMDIEGCDSDYSAQMDAMQSLTALSRVTGASLLILHHASDKKWDRNNPWKPPGRDEIKGGLSEKPELSLGVALDPDTLDYNVAILKQRMGPCDASGERYTTLTADPRTTRFYRSRHALHYPRPMVVGSD